jgi:hypothetical protein
MHEQKVKQIYKELYEQFKKLKTKIELQEGNVSQKLSDEINEMEELLTKLKNKAAAANIEVDGDHDISCIENSNDDWMQLIDCSESSEDLKIELKKHIISLGQFPSAKQTLDMVEIIDRYYDANVSHPSGTRVSEVYEKVFGKPQEEEEDASIKMYQKSAYAGLQKGIKNITTNWLIKPEVHFHIPFVAYYKEMEALPKEVEKMNIPLQFKVDLKQGKWGTAQSAGFLKFGEPTMQLSFKFSYWKDAHLVRTSNKDIFGSCIESYSQAIRNTITLKSVANGFKPQGSTTVYSKGLVIPFPKCGGSLVLKTDLGSFNWGEMIKNVSLKPSLGAVRLQGNFNLLTILPIENLLPEGITLDRAIVTLAVGFNISLNPLELSDFVDSKIKKKAKLSQTAKKVVKLDKDDIEKLKELQKKVDLLEDQAEKIGKLFKESDGKPPKGKFKDVAEEFKKHADDLFKDCKTLMKKSEVAQEAAEKLLKEAGEKIAEKIGKEALKSAAKILGRAVPVIGAIITIIEVATLIYDIYSYFNKSDLPWEEEVRIWLESWSK